MTETEEPFRQAMREEMDAREQERLGRVSGCPMCGKSATGAEWDLLKFARAMNYALGHVRLLAEAASGGMVPADHILRALSEPCRFPLPAEQE